MDTTSSAKVKGPATHLLFVYGTLIEGYNNHYLIQEAKGRKIGKGHTKLKYSMVVPSFPIALRNPKRYVIQGELYEVETLDRIDRLEGHPQWYKRYQIKVVVDGVEHTAWMYFQEKNNSGSLKVEDHGDWTKHRAERLNGVSSR
jgi:gamma-glutamylaminecyclotransferase